jgi:hypothetical protein
VLNGIVYLIERKLQNDNRDYYVPIEITRDEAKTLSNDRVIYVGESSKYDLARPY